MYDKSINTFYIIFAIIIVAAIIGINLKALLLVMALLGVPVAINSFLNKYDEHGIGLIILIAVGFALWIFAPKVIFMCFIFLAAMSLLV